MPRRTDEIPHLWFVAGWPFLLFTAFLPTFGIPFSSVGYLWNVELAVSVFLLIALFFFITSPPKGRAYDDNNRIEFLSIILPVAAIVIYSGLSAFWAVNLRNVVHHTLLWACYLLFYLLVRNIVEHRRLLSLSVQAAGIVVVILGTACLVEYIGSVKPLTFAYTIRWYKYAEALATLLPVFLALAFSSKRKIALLSATVAGMAWLVVLLSQSRTMLIASAASIVLFFGFVLWFKGLRRNVNRAAVLAVLIIALGGISQVSFGSGSNEDTTLKRFGGETSNTSARSRLLFWGIAIEAFRSHPFLGVGADNYISIYRDGREAFSARYPNSDLLEINENIIPERAHSEYLQVLSELGLVGALLFAWLLCGIAYVFFRACRNRVSLLTLGSFAGISAFLISSLSSSYSFRVPANGVCFLFVLAMAVGSSRASFSRTLLAANGPTSEPTPKIQRLILAAGIAVCLSMIVFCTVRASSLMFLERGIYDIDKASSLRSIETAISLDGQDPLIRDYYGMRLYESNRAGEASPQFRFAINHGISNSLSYFYLYCAQVKSGQPMDAQQTLEESLRVYPRSVFLLAAYSHFLKTQNRIADADVEISKAEAINPRQARSWMMAHDEGLERLTQVARVDMNYAPTSELRPIEAPLALLNFQQTSLGK